MVGQIRQNGPESNHLGGKARRDTAGTGAGPDITPIPAWRQTQTHMKPQTLTTDRRGLSELRPVPRGHMLDDRPQVGHDPVRLGNPVLPSSRSLARDLGMARGTVSAAYGQLAVEGT